MGSFLQELALRGVEDAELSLSQSAPESGFLIFLLIFLIFPKIFGYVYTSIAYMFIGKKAKDKKPWFAWIPLVGKPLLTSRIAKMHWWPILSCFLGIFFYIGGFLSLFYLSDNSPLASIILFLLAIFLGISCIIFFIVFLFIWRWKTFEAVGKPGWWVLLILVPFVGNIIFFIFLGIAAWSQEDKIEQIKKRRKKS